MTAHVAGTALQAMAAAGLDWALEARRCDVPVTLHPEFRWRVPVDRVERLFLRGCERLGPGFPVLAARRAPDAHTSPLGLYCRTRPDGRAAVRAMVEHWDLVSDGYGLAFDEREGRVDWQARRRCPEALFWFDVADVLVSAHGMVAGLPRFTVASALAPPPGIEALGCRVIAGPGHALVLPRAALDARLPPTDPSVRALLERELARLSVRGPGGPAIRGALRALGPTATLDDLADALGLSTRTLHRRLRADGTSFRRELDAIRAERARDLVGVVPIDEAAEVLGYSDARALRRAVRRWKAA